MKKILLGITLTLFLFLSMSFTPLDGDEELTKLLGEWEYLAPKARDKFHKGIIAFTHEEGELKGKVYLGGQWIPMRKIIHENHKVRAYIIVEGLQVDLYLKFQTDSFEGTVSNRMGYMRVSGNKKE